MQRKILTMSVVRQEEDRDRYAFNGYKPLGRQSLIYRQQLSPTARYTSLKQRTIKDRNSQTTRRLAKASSRLTESPSPSFSQKSSDSRSTSLSSSSVSTNSVCAIRKTTGNRTKAYNMLQRVLISECELPVVDTHLRSTLSDRPSLSQSCVYPLLDSTLTEME
jgi:hypothetical protein